MFLCGLVLHVILYAEGAVQYLCITFNNSIL